MKLLISWSGHKSKTVALKLREWIHDVLQSVEPWMSDRDIDSGGRWSPEVAGALEQTRFGIICLTRSNGTAPWILFESGALAKTLDNTFVCPYLIDMEPADIPAGPLAQFQAKRSNKNETLDLMGTINKALKDGALDGDQLKRTFELWWPDLETTLNSLPVEAPKPPRDVPEMIEETLSIVRDLSRRAFRDSKTELEEMWRTMRMRGSGTVSPSQPPVAKTFEVLFDEAEPVPSADEEE